MRTDHLALAIAAAATSLALATPAGAFCRTTTCTENCTVAADGCTEVGPHALALSWPSTCVSFDVHQDASSHVPWGAADTAARAAFGAWEAAACTTGTLGLKFQDYGPITCAQHEYNAGQGNANVIVFRDETWPYAGEANALALTTVTFNVDTAEIYDADIEVNGTANITTGMPVGYDLQAILTHEAGHFLGLAHSPDATATMFPRYLAGSTSLRSLAADDVAGACAAYPPRAEPGDCSDATPRHGFSSECAVPPTGKGSCALRSGPLPATGWVGVSLLSGLALAVRRRRQGRSRAN